MLELAVARALYDRFPEASEGRLAKIRAHVVSRQSCAVVARELGLGAVLVDRAKDVPVPELERISLSRNVLAALLEAAIAAVYLEVGFDAAATAIVAAFDARIEFASTGHVDSKTELQEALARTGRIVHYEVLEVDGPPHERRFVCAALIDGEQLGVGERLDEEGRRAGSRRASAGRAGRPGSCFAKQDSAGAESCGLIPARGLSPEGD